MSHQGGQGQKPPAIAAEEGVEFGEIEFRRRELVSATDPEIPEKLYKVFSTRTECVEVMAISAKDAIEKAGVKNPHRVIRVDMERANVLPPSFFKDSQPSKVENSTDSATTPPPEAPAAAAAEPEPKA